MGLLVETEKNIYFTDWVLQSIWEQEFLNFPSSNQSHYELAIDQDLNVIGQFFDENELWLLTLMRRTGQELKFLSP
jgi:hypothetical protein